MAKFCMNCGNANLEGSKVCSRCGNSLKNKVVVDNDDEIIIDNLSGIYLGETHNKKKLAVIAIVLVVAVALFMGSGKRKIIGTWEAVGMSQSMTFTWDGKCVDDGSQCDYKISRGILTLTHGSYSEQFRVKFSGHTMILSSADGSGGNQVRFLKQ